jgi:hypothetical protein
MNFLILLFLIPFASALTAPGCGELPGIAQEMEKDLLNKSITPVEACTKLSLPSLVSKEVTGGDVDFFDEYKCSNLAVIEAKVSQLENELALLEGFEKLKIEIAEEKKNTASSNLKSASASGRKFVDALGTAQTLDTLLSSFNKDGENFLMKLQTIPLEKRDSPEKFQETLKALCKNEGSTPPAPCQLGFAPSASTVNDINELIKGEINDLSLQEWQSAMAIQKKDGSTYSFYQMAMDLKSDFSNLKDDGSNISREQLKAIQALPEFESGAGLEFLADLKKKEGMNLKGAKFKFLVEDLAGRQAFEMTSKVSYLASEYKDLLGDSDRGQCEGAKFSLNSAIPCLEALEKISNEKGNNGDYLLTLSRTIKSLNTSKKYLGSLQKVSQECTSSAEATMSEECVKKLNGDVADVSKKLLALNLLKEKIGQSNTELMIYRNLALNKWAHNCRSDGVTSLVGECDDLFQSHISREAVTLSSNVADLAIMYKGDPKHLEEAKILCSQANEKQTSTQKKLCAFFDEPVSDVLTEDKPKKNPDEYMAPVAAPDGGHNPERDAWVRGLANITNDIVNQWVSAQNRQTPMNPYSYNYSPYSAGTGMMGISDSILFNARYYGAYGYYMPTQGLQPYTAFGAPPMASYTPYASSPSAYFSKK